MMDQQAYYHASGNILIDLRIYHLAVNNLVLQHFFVAGVFLFGNEEVQFKLLCFCWFNLKAALLPPSSKTRGIYYEFKVFLESGFFWTPGSILI